MQKRAMIVDDDPGVRYAVEVVLGDAGYEVVSADSGQACVDAVSAGYRGFVLLDVMMPGMDGWDTITALVEHKLIDRVLVCMLTAKDAPDEAMDPVKEWVIDYLTKPFDPQALVRVVDMYCTEVVE